MRRTNGSFPFALPPAVECNFCASAVFLYYHKTIDATYVSRTVAALWRNHCYCGIANIIACYWCNIDNLSYPSCELHAPYHTVLPYVAYLDLPHVLNHLINGKIFEKKKDIERQTCILNFSTTLV
jgi:hypothetical protein